MTWGEMYVCKAGHVFGSLFVSSLFKTSSSSPSFSSMSPPVFSCKNIQFWVSMASMFASEERRMIRNLPWGLPLARVVWLHVFQARGQQPFHLEYQNPQPLLSLGSVVVISLQTRVTRSVALGLMGEAAAPCVHGRGEIVLIILTAQLAQAGLVTTGRYGFQMRPEAW